MNTKRIILITDQPVLAYGLKAALAEYGMELHATYPDIASACPEMGNGPCVAILNLTPEIGFTALCDIRSAAVNSTLILWAGEITHEFAFQAMGLGIRGILRKTLPAESIARCIQMVGNGELWFEKAFTDAFVDAKRTHLTQREGQLTLLLSHGLKNKEIAGRLGISEGTVKVYLSRLFRKLGVGDRLELALYAARNLGPVDGTLNGNCRKAPAGESPAPLAAPRSIVMEPRPTLNPRVKPGPYLNLPGARERATRHCA
jgi:DNA-binding NarL/FixJ family response regulator